MRFPPSCRSAQAKESECPPLSWASSSLRQQPNSGSAAVPVACIASTARTPLAVFRRAPWKFDAWLCSTPRGGSKGIDAHKVKSTHVSPHRRVWKVAGMSSLPSPSSSFLGHRVGSSDVIDETSLNAAFCSSYASCKKTENKNEIGQGRAAQAAMAECAWNCWPLLTRAWLTDADILDCRT